MAVNKVVYGGTTIIDITDSTVTKETLAEGATAYDKSGAKITGTMKAGEDLNAVLAEQESLIAELKELLNHKAEGSGGGSNVSADWLAKVTALIERVNATDLVVPSGFTQLGEHFFHACNKLVSCIIEPGISTIATHSFYGCTALTNLVIPNTVTTVNGYLCYGCTALTSIELPDSITILGTNAFRGCTVLTDVKLPANLLELNNYTFMGCSSLTSVKIPSKVTQVGSHVFYDCTALQEADFSELTAVPKLTNINAFNNVPTTCTIKVPKALYNEWIATTNWSTFADRIVAV